MLVTFWEENSVNVSEVRFLRKIFGFKGEEVRGDWRKLHKEEPHDLQVCISQQTMLGRFLFGSCTVRLDIIKAFLFHQRMHYVFA
jgi:hypothetical protein